MKLTTRGSVAAAFMACMATAVTITPAAAGTSVPVDLPLENLERVLPIEAPELRTGVPVPVAGAPDGTRYVTGRMLPKRTLPSVPFTAELPETAVELPVKDPLGEGSLGALRAVSKTSDLGLSSPGASLGAPVSAPRSDLRGRLVPVLPQVAPITPVLQGTPAAALLMD
ncbi:hypothetical protein [Streptomyces chryseus]|uniref:Secreted protein n=2 Tax=Streptomyces chryseus TaxID=68186 RepID=A0ABQ3DKD1_9ACTN|nr:hypothetical protein [Streptomyces chryseus]GHB04053.1 hypothetical protein GCM10010346_28680 [Streptomyces chryseus]